MATAVNLQLPEIKKPTLVDNAGSAWKWLSVQAMALAGAVQATWLALPDEFKTTIPANYVQYLTFALLVLGIGGRLVKQP